jgi:hypothetical protein
LTRNEVRVTIITPASPLSTERASDPIGVDGSEIGEGVAQPGVVFGPDPINDTEASGILLFASDPRPS